MCEMGKARHILAVTLVATALCADRAAAAGACATAAATGSRTGNGRVTSMAGRFVIRLSNNFRRAVPTIALRPGRSLQAARSIEIAAPVRVVIAPQQFDPFQFRLPPPVS
jgi:hypothetical protein